MNPNTEYEKFSLEVYHQLLSFHHAQIKKVEHNIKLKGRSGCEHQIDVYWEYEKDGIAHHVAIECKNYNRRIQKEKVCAFQGVLADLGQVEGIMVSKKGYQKGAKEYAKEFSISLKELRSPKRGETIIGEFGINFHSEIRRTLFKVDENWAFEHHIDIAGYKQRMDMISFNNTHKWSNSTHIPLHFNDSIIRDAKNKEVTSLEALETIIPDHPTENFPFVFPFEDAYVNTPWGPVKILEVMFDYEIDDQQKSFFLDADGFVKAILKDALSGNTDFMVMR